MASSVSISVGGKYATGNKFRRHGTGNLGTYATGGVAITAAQLALSVIDDLQVMPAGGYVFEWNKTTGLVLAYEEEAAAAGGPLLEVGNGTNLAGVTFRFEAVGH